MPNDLIRPTSQLCLQPTSALTMDLHQGDCVQLIDSNELFQVIGIDDCHDRCWVRRWPLQASGGSHVFEISLGQIDQTDASDHHAPAPGTTNRP